MKGLFDTIGIGKMSLRNRFVRSATFDGCADENGLVTDRQIELFSRLAEGGVGLIISGITYVHPGGQLAQLQSSISRDECTSGLKELTAAVHKRGAKIAVQLFHGGRIAAGFLNARNELAIAPSYRKDDPYFKGEYRPMTEEEIREVISSFGEGARRAGEAGFDAVQIHGAHGFLFSQFLSPYTNHRRDEWGGTLENRLRIHREVYRDIRKKVGNDFPILIKIGVQDGFSGGLEFTEGKEAARHLADLGYDALEISLGLRGKGFEESEFRTRIDSLDREAYYRSWCREIKRETGALTMVMGGLRTYKLMEEIIQNEEADFISISRPLIREPGLINDWKNGDARRPECISCNQCLESVRKGQGVQCTQKT